MNRTWNFSKMLIRYDLITTSGSLEAVSGGRKRFHLTLCLYVSELDASITMFLLFCTTAGSTPSMQVVVYFDCRFTLNFTYIRALCCLSSNITAANFISPRNSLHWQLDFHRSSLVALLQFLTSFYTWHRASLLRKHQSRQQLQFTSVFHSLLFELNVTSNFDSVPI